MIILTEKQFTDKYQADVVETSSLIRKINYSLISIYGFVINGQLENDETYFRLKFLGFSKSDNRIAVVIIRNSQFKLKDQENNYIIYVMPNHRKIKEILKMKAFI